MSRGTSQPQSDSSSDWLQNKLIELRRLLRETEYWPETGDQLIKNLSRPITTSPHPTSSEEDYDMLSIVVNDALLGIDIMKKYPAFYTQMLVDEELRTAFLDTLELLEQSRSGELPEYIAPEPLNLDFLQQVMSKPIIRRSGTEKLELVWQRTVDQLQKMFQIALLRPQEIYRSEDTLFDTNPTNILHSQVEIGGQELNIRLDALQTPNNPENVELMITIFTAEELAHNFEATVVWGNYEASSRVNKYGLAKFPPLNTNLIFIPSGELIHGLELRLEQIS